MAQIECSLLPVVREKANPILNVSQDSDHVHFPECDGGQQRPTDLFGDVFDCADSETDASGAIQEPNAQSAVSLTGCDSRVRPVPRSLASQLSRALGAPWSCRSAPSGSR